MQPTRLGRSGLHVSPLCLGTMMFGGQADQATSKSIADLALDHGVFFWDTADMYGGGKSEETLRELLVGRRQRVVLATKGWAQMGPGPNDRGLSARHLIAACEASLKRLGTEWIDLYYLHLPDRGTPIDETLRAAEDLVRSGKVRYLGASNFWTWEYVRLIETARASGWQPISAIQPLYNAVNRDIEVEMLPMADAYGLGVVTYSSLARGVLTGKYSWEGTPPAGSRLDRQDRRFLQAEWRQESLQMGALFRATAEDRGCSPGQLATAWAMKNQLVHSVIIGPRTLAQAEDALGAARIAIDAELEAAVDAIVPPGTHSGKVWPDPAYYPVTGRRT
ncbi:MAG: aldo/keto reductase [Deltaproteobacteria bacterium]|nr:MAG: aldo/keto reductase [Deltaproteobacteria bacterium]